ncbi:MAG: GvpL/GvpF family gas vesicle protein [Catenulispora sp.]
MSAPAEQAEQMRTTGCYVYGIVPSDVEMTAEVRGVGDPPAKVRLVRHNDISAIVSDVDLDRPLGTPDDLTAHAEVLDALAASVPVLPVRFGSVLTNQDAVVDELLAPHHDDFVAAVDELDGKAEYVVRGRFVEQAVLGEILAENEAAGQLRERIHGLPDDATRNERIQLGELVSKAINQKREATVSELLEAVGEHAVATSVREPAHEEDAAQVAFLVANSDRDAFEQALEKQAGRWEGRVQVRLLGPVAAYDFVRTSGGGG